MTTYQLQDEVAPVLVVGGSLVGLSTAMFLADRGVRVVLVERHRGSSPHPRAIGYTARTMELFATLGLTAQIPQAPPSFRLHRARVESLAGRRLDESDWTPPSPGVQQQRRPPAASPWTGAAIAQDKLEPLLRDKARALGADLRLGTELLRFEQDGDGVTAWLAERDGRRYQLRARYLIACDGHRSAVREALGIARQGPGPLQTLRSVLFRAPLDEYLASGVSQFEIEQPELKAFLTTYNDGRWVLMFHDDVEREPAALRTAIARAIGRDDVPVEIVTTGRWELTALVAERFAVGRVFLAGDAAHTLPPTRGGYGANTGIHDAHNLAWKLAAVLAGRARPELLDSYDAERRPVAWTRLEQTFARPDYARFARGFADGVAILDETAIELGQLYRSAAVSDDDAGDAGGARATLPAARRPDEWRGQPGTRAPHLWVVRDGVRRSTLELLGRDWTLLATGDRWADAATAAARTLDLPLTTVRLDALRAEDGDGESLRRAFGLDAGGATLVRPDGYIAWRAAAAPSDATATLTAALAQLAMVPR